MVLSVKRICFFFPPISVLMDIYLLSVLVCLAEGILSQVPHRTTHYIPQSSVLLPFVCSLLPSLLPASSSHMVSCQPISAILITWLIFFFYLFSLHFTLQNHSVLLACDTHRHSHHTYHICGWCGKGGGGG